MKPTPGLCAVVPLLDATPDRPIGRQLGLVASEYRLELTVFGDGAIGCTVEIQGSATGDVWTAIATLKASGTDQAVAVQLVRLAHAPHYRAQVVSASGEVQRVRLIASRSRDGELAALEADLHAFEQQRGQDRQIWREYMAALERFVAETDKRFAELVAERQRDRQQVEELAALTRREIAQRDELIRLLERDRPQPPRSLQ